MECDAVAVEDSGLARQLCILQMYPLPLGPTDLWRHNVAGDGVDFFEAKWTTLSSRRDLACCRSKG